ncbi:hypothetical protein [Phenylobacterium conjunctum]|uniref:Uncharacterized protein n=1 Tax=Phenylobacterium conjunctum TaxID=1298959 RepID=A0ABW3T3G2_9CAUL
MTLARNSHVRMTPTAEVIACQIRETLLLFGGEAHRRDVIAQLARDRGLDVRRIPPELEREVIDSFERACRAQALGLHPKFGEGSHRWAVRTRALAS